MEKKVSATLKVQRMSIQLIDYKHVTLLAKKHQGTCCIEKSLSIFNLYICIHYCYCLWRFFDTIKYYEFQHKDLLQLHIFFHRLEIFFLSVSHCDLIFFAQTDEYLRKFILIKKIVWKHLITFPYIIWMIKK